MKPAIAKIVSGLFFVSPCPSSTSCDLLRIHTACPFPLPLSCHWLYLISFHVMSSLAYPSDQGEYINGARLSGTTSTLKTIQVDKETKMIHVGKLYNKDWIQSINEMDGLRQEARPASNIIL